MCAHCTSLPQVIVCPLAFGPSFIPPIILYCVGYTDKECSFPTIIFQPFFCFCFISFLFVCLQIMLRASQRHLGVVDSKRRPEEESKSPREYGRQTPRYIVSVGTKYMTDRKGCDQNFKQTRRIHTINTSACGTWLDTSRIPKRTYQHQYRMCIISKTIPKEGKTNI